MSAWKLILAELRGRPVNFLLCLMAVIVAAAMFVSGPTLLSGYASDARDEMARLQADADKLQSEADRLHQEVARTQGETDAILREMDDRTRRIMRDMGVNLRIVHEDTNFGDLYTDFVARDFPESYVQQLASSESLETIVHVVATLQERIKWNNRTVLLVGTMPVMTVSQKNESKGHMIKPIKPGTVLVGHELGFDRQVGDEIEINGHTFTIAEIKPEFGGLQDVQLVVDLHDAQRVLEKPDRVNQILALGCKCKGDRISVIRKELEGVLPETKITEDRNLATAREEQRDLVAAKRKEQLALVEANLLAAKQNLEAARETYEQQAARRDRQQRVLARLINVVTPAVVLIAALFVGLMTWLNVRERRAEIGLLRALGKRTAEIAALFLGKAAGIGLLGGVVGVVVGLIIVRSIGQSLGITPDYLQTNATILAITLAGAPLVAAMASYLPTLSAVMQDPAAVLLE